MVVIPSAGYHWVILTVEACIDMKTCFYWFMQINVQFSKDIYENRTNKLIFNKKTACFRMSRINLWRAICTCLSCVASFCVFPFLTLASSFSHTPIIFPAPHRSDVKSIFLACPSSDRKTIMPFFQAERKPLPSLKQLERAPFPPKLACGPSLPMQADNGPPTPTNASPSPHPSALKGPAPHI